MTHYPVYGNVSRWVFSGGRERGRPDVDYGYAGVGGFRDEDPYHAGGKFRPSQRFRPADGMYIPQPANTFTNAYDYNAGVLNSSQRRASQKSTDTQSGGRVYQRKVKGRVETCDKYESLNPSAQPSHEYLEGHNFSQEASGSHLDCFKHANGGKKRYGNKSNRGVHLYRRESDRSQSHKSDILQESFSGSRRHASYQNYLMESNVSNGRDSTAVIESSLVSRGDSHNSAVLREILRKEQDQEQQDGAETEDDIHDSSFDTDFDESYERGDEPAKDTKDDDVYENGGIIKMLMREMQGSGRLRSLRTPNTSTPYENEVSQKREVGSYENEDVVRKMPTVEEGMDTLNRESYENETSRKMVPGSYENEEIVNKMPTPKDLEDVHYTHTVGYENQFSMAQHPGSYENEHVVRKMPSNPYEDDVADRHSYCKELLRDKLSTNTQNYDASSLGSINLILKQLEFEDEFDGISTKPASVEENIYSSLDDHLTHQNKIYNASVNTYLEPASNHGNDRGFHQANTPTPVPPPRQSRVRSNICRSISSMNTPVYENFPSVSGYTFTPELKDSKILASNLSLNADSVAEVQAPDDEIFYAVTPAIQSPNTPFIGSPDVFLQSPNTGIPISSGFPVLTSDIFTSASPFMPSASQVFMKEEFEHQLDVEARKLHTRAALYIQKFIRMYLARRKFMITQHKTCKIQAAIRMHLAR